MNYTAIAVVTIIFLILVLWWYEIIPGFGDLFSGILGGIFGTPAECPQGWVESSPGICKKPCAANQKETGGICYTNCPDGWKGGSTDISCLRDRQDKTRDVKSPSVCPSGTISDGTMCYPACPSGSSMDSGQYTCRTTCSGDYSQGPNTCTPKTAERKVTQNNAGKGVSQVCPSDRTYVNGLCYPKCPSGTEMTSQGICTQPCPSGYYWTGSSCQINPNTPLTLTDCGRYGGSNSCPAGYSKSAACSCQLTKPTIPLWELRRYDYTRDTVTPNTCPSDKPVKGADGRCYPACPSGSSMDSGQYTCRANCPSGYDQYPNTCTKSGGTITRKVTQDNAGKGKSMLCPADRPNNVNGLCYPKCADGYSMDSQGICYEICPTGWRADLGSCYKPGESNTKSAGEVGTCPEGKTKSGVMCY